MSFFTDLIEGNFGNLGNDILHAPSSLASHPDELAETLGVGGLIAAPFLIPELGAAIGIGGVADTAAAGGVADAAAAGDVIAATGETIGPGDALLSGLAGGAGGAGDAALLGAGDLAGAGAPIADFGGAGALLSADAPFLADTSLASADLSATGASSDLSASIAAADPATTTLATDPNAATAAAGATNPVPPATIGSTPAGVGVNPVTGGTDPLGDVTGGAASSTTGGGITSGLSSILSSPWTRLALGAAPLALTLARGETQLPSGAQSLQAQALQMQQTGLTNLNQAQQGILNAGQTAQISQMRNDLMNQWLQTLKNQGVQDPTKDSRWPQILATIDTQVTAATATLIQNNIQNALAETGQASSALTSIANMQFQADQAFTNAIVAATKSLGLVAGLGFGTKTTTTTTAA